jgi:hypothetical protein
MLSMKHAASRPRPPLPSAASGSSLRSRSRSTPRSRSASRDCGQSRGCRAPRTAKAANQELERKVITRLRPSRVRLAGRVHPAIDDLIAHGESAVATYQSCSRACAGPADHVGKFSRTVPRNAATGSGIAAEPPHRASARSPATPRGDSSAHMRGSLAARCAPSPDCAMRAVVRVARPRASQMATEERAHPRGPPISAAPRSRSSPRHGWGSSPCAAGSRRRAMTTAQRSRRWPDLSVRSKASSASSRPSGSERGIDFARHGAFARLEPSASTASRSSVISSADARPRGADRERRELLRAVRGDRRGGRGRGGRARCHPRHWRWREAIVVRGHVLEGPNGIAGEWGHNPLPWPRDDERPGPQCYCGLAGCIETLVSGPTGERSSARDGSVAEAAAIVSRAAVGRCRLQGGVRPLRRLARRARSRT